MNGVGPAGITSSPGPVPTAAFSRPLRPLLAPSKPVPFLRSLASICPGFETQRRREKLLQRNGKHTGKALGASLPRIDRFPRPRASHLSHQHLHFVSFTLVTSSTLKHSEIAVTKWKNGKTGKKLMLSFTQMKAQKLPEFGPRCYTTRRVALQPQ